jgi:hypothetical protein
VDVLCHFRCRSAVDRVRLELNATVVSTASPVQRGGDGGITNRDGLVVPQTRAGAMRPCAPAAARRQAPGPLRCSPGVAWTASLNAR